MMLNIYLLLGHLIQLAADAAKHAGVRSHTVVQRDEAQRGCRAGGVQQVQHELRVALKVLVLDEETHAAAARALRNCQCLLDPGEA